MLQQMGASVDCTVPYFGFKAKQWTRGPPFNPHCTVPYFGFKAKLNLNRPQI